MIKFINAKINIGLYITGERADGYHNLQTVFYPVGLECGLPHQAQAFDDILEIVNDPSGMSGCRFQFMGRKINCEPEKNLVVKATRRFLRKFMEKGGDLEKYGMFELILDKHLPDGAGLGGGSADAAFTIKTLNEITGELFTDRELKEIAVSLGADCPFFLENRPCYAEGIGEILTPIELHLPGVSILIVKPPVFVSTKEAFEGVDIRKPDFDLRKLPELPLEEWKDKVFNDFETTVFQKHPELKKIKEELYAQGAVYASMSGSGSALYGLFKDKGTSFSARDKFLSTYSDVWLFGL